MSIHTETAGAGQTELRQLARFAAVGAVGFVVNVVTVYLFQVLIGVHGAGALAFVAAASVTWLGNRVWTFGHAVHGPMGRQWLLFLATNLLGFAIYYATFEIALALFQLVRTYPVIAVMAGSLTGMLVNFTLSRRVVFA